MGWLLVIFTLIVGWQVGLRLWGNLHTLPEGYALRVTSSPFYSQRYLLYRGDVPIYTSKFIDVYGQRRCLRDCVRAAKIDKVNGIGV